MQAYNELRWWANPRERSVEPIGHAQSLFGSCRSLTILCEHACRVTWASSARKIQSAFKKGVGFIQCCLSDFKTYWAFNASLFLFLLQVMEILWKIILILITRSVCKCNICVNESSVWIRFKWILLRLSPEWTLAATVQILWRADTKSSTGDLEDLGGLEGLGGDLGDLGMTLGYLGGTWGGGDWGLGGTCCTDYNGFSSFSLNS